MKRLTALLLCLVMVLALFTACGTKKTESGTNPGNGSPTVTPPPAEIGGGGASGGHDIIEADKYKDTFKIGGQMEYPTLDIHESLNAYYVCTSVYDTLLTYDNGSFVPALATEWNKIDSLTWEFKLRDGVTFHDGSKFVAEDVKFTMERGLNTPGSSLGARLSCIDSVEVVDDLTVKFHLNVPNQDFLLCMANGYASIMSKTACEKEADGYKYGTGPWKVTDFKPSISVTMERYDDFWGELPKTKTMVYVTYPEDASRLVALQSGEVDCSLVVNSADNATVESDDRIVGVPILDSGFAFLAFNQNEKFMDDVNFRKACCYAIDPEAVLAVSCEGYGVPINSFWGGGAYGSAEDSIEGFHYDPDLAAEYLAKTDYQGEEIKIYCGVQEYVTNATIYADMLAEVGINCVLEEKDFLGIARGCSYDNHEHQMLSWAAIWSASGDDCRRYLHSGQSANNMAVCYPELDEMIDNALYEEDEATRLKMYHDIQQFVIDNALYLPVYRSTYYCAETPNTGGIKWSSDCNDYNFRYACVAILD